MGLGADARAVPVLDRHRRLLLNHIIVNMDSDSDANMDIDTVVLLCAVCLAGLFVADNKKASSLD